MRLRGVRDEDGIRLELLDDDGEVVDDDFDRDNITASEAAHTIE